MEEIENYSYCIYDEILRCAETVYAMSSNKTSAMISLNTGINPIEVIKKFELFFEEIKIVEGK